jgi:hypothetical protein
VWLDSWHWARVGLYPDAVRVEVALGEIRQTLAEVPVESGGATIARFAYAPIRDDGPPADAATAYGF